jgi:uncharacterized protein YecE (DUF72 family)
MAESGRDSLAGSPPPSTKPGIAVGTAGFSYPDWIGPVYARGTIGVRALSSLARWVDLLEVNVSHYRIPSPATARAWRAATADRPAFRFTAKLWRGYTHGPPAPSRADHAAQRAFFDAMAEDGRLDAVLAQFPPSFRAGPRERAYVARLAGHVAGHRLAVEFRDASWDTDEVRAELSAAGTAWVVGDWTPGPGWIEPRALASAPLAYVRLHGRNPAWYRRGVGRDVRYDYSYGPEELAAWAERVRRLRAVAASVVVVANNHFGGQAVANALELRALLGGAPVPGPASLVAAFPRLAGRVVPEAPSARMDPADGGWFNHPGG